MSGTGWRTHTSVDLYLAAPVEVEVRAHDVERPFVAVELRDAELTVLVVDLAGVSRLIEALTQAREELAALLAGQERLLVDEGAASVPAGAV
jgi:hypothetical protein